MSVEEVRAVAFIRAGQKPRATSGPPPPACSQQHKTGRTEVPWKSCCHNTEAGHGAALRCLKAGLPLGTQPLGKSASRKPTRGRERSTQLVEQCRANGWRARCEPIEVGSRAFTGQSLCRAYKRRTTTMVTELAQDGCGSGGESRG